MTELTNTKKVKPWFISGFRCIDCSKAGRDTVITRDQAIQTGEKYGRGLCDTCAFVAKPREI